MPDTIGGLPLHPLVVHAAVVLLPLSALGLLVVLALPRARRTYGWLPVLGLGLSVIAAWVAKETGENLAEVIGLPQEHAEWGDRLVPIAAVLFIASLAWYWRVRSGATGALTTVAAASSAVLAVVAIGVVVVVGHSGAEAAWAGKIEAAAGTAVSGDGAGDAAAPAPAASPAAAGDGATAPLTMDVVAQHATPSDCWAAIDGNVYNLTDWISQHPGGSGVIEAMCGTDGSDAFNNQHGGQGQPASELKNFLIGALQ